MIILNKNGEAASRVFSSGHLFSVMHRGTAMVMMSVWEIMY